MTELEMYFFVIVMMRVEVVSGAGSFFISFVLNIHPQAGRFCLVKWNVGPSQGSCIAKEAHNRDSRGTALNKLPIGLHVKILNFNGRFEAYRVKFLGINLGINRSRIDENLIHVSMLRYKLLTRVTSRYPLTAALVQSALVEIMV